MKKLVAILLITVICISMVACANAKTEEKAMIGEWKNLDGDDILVFQSGNILYRNGEKLNWWFDSNASQYCIIYNGMSFYFSPRVESGVRCFEIEGEYYFHADDYMKALMMN